MERNGWFSSGCSGVLMTPGETALTRMPRPAYSTASAFVVAATPPLLSEASAEGTLAIALSTSVVVTLTTWPPSPCSSMRAMASWLTWKKPSMFVDFTAA